MNTITILALYRGAKAKNDLFCSGGKELFLAFKLPASTQVPLLTKIAQGKHQTVVSDVGARLCMHQHIPGLYKVEEDSGRC